MKNPEFKEITLEDKQVFNHFFNSYLPKISEFTFTNLFIWSKPKNIKYSLYDEGLIMKASDREGRPYFLPPIGYNNCEEILKFIMDYGRLNGINLIELLPEFQKKYIKHQPCRIITDRNSFDYIYKSQSLATLKGWRLDGKRGFIKKFEQNYKYEYVRYDKSYENDCLSLYKTWMGEKHKIDKGINDEHIVFEEFIENFDKLDAVGGLIYIGGKLVAFSFGERLNDTTFVIHFEKADTDYPGSYQVINQEFVRNEVADFYPFVNREQDMGIEGLRKAKLSYAPFRLLKKYTVDF